MVAYKSNDLFQVLNLACLKATGFYLPADAMCENRWKYKLEGEKKKGVLTHFDNTFLKPCFFNDFTLQVGRRIIVDSINTLRSIKGIKQELTKKVKSLTQDDLIQVIPEHHTLTIWANGDYKSCAKGLAEHKQHIYEILSFMGLTDKWSYTAVQRRVVKLLQDFIKADKPETYHLKHLTSTDLIMFNKKSSEFRGCRGVFDRGEKFDLNSVHTRFDFIKWGGKKTNGGYWRDAKSTSKTSTAIDTAHHDKDVKRWMKRNDFDTGYHSEKINKKGRITNKNVPYKNKKQYAELFDEISPLFYKHLRKPRVFKNDIHITENKPPEYIYQNGISTRSVINDCFESVFGYEVERKMDAPDRVKVWRRFNHLSNKFEVDEILRIYSDKNGTEFQTTMDKLTAWFMSN